jgi:hypothetical protein
LRPAVDVRELLGDDERIAITDDRPLNEYVVLRRAFGAPEVPRAAPPG